MTRGNVSPMPLILEKSPELTSVDPRFGTRRNPLRPTRGAVDREISRTLGWPMFPWQGLAADVAGEYDDATLRPFYRIVGIGVARQNGKTYLVCTRVARQLIVRKQTVAYTAQDRGLARLKWMEHVELLMETPFAARVDRVERQRTQECLYMKNGSRYMPVTPVAKKAGRSLSIDLAVIDEAYAHESMGVISALNPTMITRKHAQIWILSNAGDHTSLLWRHYTDLGRSEVDNPDASMCWIEYAADPAADVHDEQAWMEANPSLGLPGGVDFQALREASTSLEPLTFKREHLNLWEVDAASSTIDPLAWAGCFSDMLVPGAQVVFGLEYSEGRESGALVVAGDVDGVTPLEVIESTTDLELLARRAAANAIAAETVVCVAHGTPAASAIPALERATKYRKAGHDVHRVRVISVTEQTRAAGDFHDAVKNARVTHQADYRLTDSVKKASKRRVGESWTWARAGASTNELIAATWARYGVLTQPVEAPVVAKVTSAARRRIPSRR